MDGLCAPTTVPHLRLRLTRRHLMQAEQSSPRPPSSLLTEGETRDDGRLWPKLGEWGAASIQLIIRSVRVALGRECKKVTTRGAARRKTRCEPAPRSGGLHDRQSTTLNTSRKGTVPKSPAKAGWASRYSIRAFQHKEPSDQDRTSLFVLFQRPKGEFRSPRD